MSAEPYLSAARTSARRRRAAEGLGPRIGRAVFQLATLAVLIPMVRSIFLAFLDEAPELQPEGLQAVLLRGALVVMTWVGMDVHASVLRGPSRAVLSVLPVDPVGVVRTELVGVAWRGVAIAVAVSLLLTPVGLELGPVPWALSLGVLLLAVLVSLAWSTVLLQGAIDAAESEAWAPLLDALRGNNPRPQAAIIYALAPLILVGGLLLDRVAAGAVAVWQGHPEGLVWWGTAVVLSAVGAARIDPLSDRVWFRASLVLEEIKARYASVERPDEAHRVYMDWTVRWLPDDVARWALLDLRHGWREWRGTLGLTWLVAMLAFSAGWSETPGTAVRAGLVAGMSAWWAGGLAVRMSAETPEFLAAWLPAPRGPRALSRMWVVLAWTQASAWLAALAVLLRLGVTASLTALGVAWASGLVAGGVAAGLGDSGRKALVPYVGIAAVVLASSAAWLEGG